MNLTEDEALNSILGEVFGTNDNENIEPTPDVEVQTLQEEKQEPQMTPQQERVEEQGEVAIPQNQILPTDSNKELIDRLIATQEQNQVLMQKIAEVQQQANQQQQQLSEEEMALQQLKERTGIDKIEKENEMLKQQIQQIIQANDERAKQDAIAQQQAQMQDAIRIEANKFMQEFPDVKPETIMDYIKTQPKDVQHQFDTPQGWRMIATVLKSQATSVQKPDPIVSTNNSNTPNVSAFDKRKSGQAVSDTDLVSELLGLA